MKNLQCVHFETSTSHKRNRAIYWGEILRKSANQQTWIADKSFIFCVGSSFQMDDCRFEAGGFVQIIPAPLRGNPCGIFPFFDADQFWAKVVVWYCLLLTPPSS